MVLARLWLVLLRVWLEIIVLLGLCLRTGKGVGLIRRCLKARKSGLGLRVQLRLLPLPHVPKVALDLRRPHLLRLSLLLHTLRLILIAKTLKLPRVLSILVKPLAIRIPLSTRWRKLNLMSSLFLKPWWCDGCLERSSWFVLILLPCVEAGLEVCILRLGAGCISA